MDLLSNLQKPHVTRLLNILATTGFALDLSGLGVGKTYCACAVAAELNLPSVLILCPKSVSGKWADVSSLFGVTAEVSTFGALRGTHGHQPKHGYLTRMNNEDGWPRLNIIATKKWQKKVEDGVLVIVDEFQHLKNWTAQTKCCRELFGPAIKSTKSKVLLVSGSPFDHADQIVSFYRMLGIMSRDELITAHGTWVGMAEIYHYLLQTCPAAATWLAMRNPTNSAACHWCAYITFQTFLKVQISSTCARPPHGRFPVIVKEAHYHMNDTRELKAAVHGLGQAAASQNLRHNVPDRLHAIETAKLPLFWRLIEEKLLYSNYKVVAVFNNTSSVEEACKRFATYCPLVLVGATSTKARQAVIDDFSQNTRKHRLLIGNFYVCATGIDLDDKHGNMPRFAFVSPTYSSQNMYQFSHRFDRIDTRSQAEVHMVFCSEATEIGILRSLARKGDVMHATTPNADAVFPGDYARYDEDAETRRLGKKCIRDKRIAMALWICSQAFPVYPIQRVMIDAILCDQMNEME